MYLLKCENEFIRYAGVVELDFVIPNKSINQIDLSKDISMNNFLVELGSMDDGLELAEIIGCDFMKEIKMVIDLGEMNIQIN